MRHGKIVASMKTSETSVDAIARAMVGGDLPTVAAREARAATPCLHIADLTAGSDERRVENLSLDVGAGEIVGIAGVEGNGQTTLADAIAGMITYEGSIVQDPGSGAKMGIIPQDRQHEALVMNWPIVDNSILGRQHRPAALKSAREDARRIVEGLDVRAASLDVTVRTLSGGNQQKIVVGRALIDNPSLVLAYNPTRGIDVGAAALVQSRLIQARNAGAAVLLISFELDELLALADRIAVMYRGKIVGAFTREQFDRGAIGNLMAGSK